MMKKEDKKDFCSYCDYTGIIYNHGSEILGENVLVPCPKCVIPLCKCNNEDPYYIFENENIVPCPCRYIRMKIDKILAIYYSAGIGKYFRWKTWSDFKPESDLAHKAYSAAYDIVMNFPDVKKGLYLWGNPGTGKTLLSVIILTELIKHHAIKGRFIKITRDFFSMLKSTFAESSERYGESSLIEKEFAEVDILVIDDFGVQRDSPWEQETLYNLIDGRYEGGKFTIITSNNNPEQALKELSGGRILSRLREMCKVLELSGKDYREKK
ncbi:MAG: ATP-binding protein [Leptospirales bacterium]|nr:ATP-binding protein [Leptospirales bacterium]